MSLPVEYGVGAAIGSSLATRKLMKISYKILSNIDNYKTERKKSHIYLLALGQCLLFIGVFALLYLAIAAVCVFAPDLDFCQGILFGLIGVHFIIFPSVVSIFNERYATPYWLTHKEVFRWGLGITYEDELDKFIAWCDKSFSKGDHTPYILLDRKTNKILNEPVQVPNSKKSTKIILIIISILATIFSVLMTKTSMVAGMAIFVICFTLLIKALVYYYE